MFEKIQANVKTNLYPDYIPKINKVPKGMSKKHLDLSALVGSQISGYKLKHKLLKHVSKKATFKEQSNRLVRAPSIDCMTMSREIKNTQEDEEIK
jgi:hypothetical protein